MPAWAETRSPTRSCPASRRADPGASAYVFLNDRPGAARLAFALEAEDFRRRSPPTGPSSGVARIPVLVRRALQRNPASLHERIRGVGTRLGRPVFPLQTAFSRHRPTPESLEDVADCMLPRFLVAAGDGISETSYGWLWFYLARELNVTFTARTLRRDRRMNDLQTFNVLIIPDGKRRPDASRAGDDASKLKAWCAREACSSVMAARAISRRTRTGSLEHREGRARQRREGRHDRAETRPP